MISNGVIVPLLKRSPWLICGVSLNRGSHSYSAYKDGCAVGSENRSQLFETNKLLHAYANHGRMVDARRVFDTMPNHNVVSWTVMILGYAKHEDAALALELYEHMHQEGVQPSERTFVAALKACSDFAPVEHGNQADIELVEALLEKGRAIHSQVVKTGSDLNVFVGTTLLDMYAKYETMEDARYVFEKLSYRNVVSWNAMISGYVRKEDGWVALDLYAKLRQECIMPDHGTFVSTLKACSTLVVHEETKQIALVKGRCLHCEIVKSGFESYIFVGTTLIDMYAKCGSMDDAQHTFDNLPHRDVVAWNAMILGYANEQEAGQALGLYRWMQQESLLPNQATFFGALKACSSLGTWEGQTGRSIHSQVVKKGFDLDGFVGTSLVDMYAKCGSLGDAQHVFNQLSHHDVVSWTAMILGHAKAEEGALALEFYYLMQQKGAVPDDRTFIGALKACSTLAAKDKDGNFPTVRFLEKGRVVHSQVVEGRFEMDTFVGNSLLDMYANCGSMDDARNVFDKLPNRDVVSWTAMILGYAKEEEGALALELYALMQQEAVLPDDQTFVGLLKACYTLVAREKEKHVDCTFFVIWCREKGQILHSHLVEGGFELDAYVGNSLVIMYANFGSLDDARNVYDKLPHHDVVSCTTMIFGYAEQEANEEAVKLHAEMQEQGLSGDSLTFVSILKACCQTPLLGNGKVIHAWICRFGLEAGAIVATTLVVMYAKCGSMDDAQYLFDALALRSLLLWNALISGYARQGESDFVFILLERMRQEGEEPDEGTLLSVLNMCSHSGLVDESFAFFHAMRERYGVTPIVEHYTCMVDLFGRAALVDKAVTIMENMPFQPDVVAWVNVLGACQQWNNVNIGRHAFENAVILNEKHASAYVLMSNVYACANMWEDRPEACGCPRG